MKIVKWLWLVLAIISLIIELITKDAQYTTFMLCFIILGSIAELKEIVKSNNI